MKALRVVIRKTQEMIVILMIAGLPDSDPIAITIASHRDNYSPPKKNSKIKNLYSKSKKNSL